MPASNAIIELPDRYRPLRHLANGGMASVWAAHDTLLDRDVAIKLLAPHLAQDPRARERFKREARMAAGLSAHPNAVTIYDVGEYDGRSFIVMEALPGGSLADCLRAAGRVPHERALEWLGQAARALDAAHARGLIHRDVKPGNMLFDEHRRLLLADFGIARLAYDPTLTTTGEILGTAAYISPEQADGRSATPASDLYSLAVVAYELLTGTRPFRAEHFAATARQHIDQPPDPPSLRERSLPDAVDEVLLRGLAKEPSERWPSATAMVEALRSALAHEPVSAPATIPIAAAPGAGDEAVKRSASPGRRRWAPLVLAALCIVALGAVVAVVVSSGGSDPKPKGVVAENTATERSQPDRQRTASTATSSQPTRTTTTTTATGPAQQPAATTPAQGGDAAALNSLGFGLMNDGRHREAVTVLRRAVRACGDDPQNLTCAYAMYNLGRSLRLAGRPAEAIPVLERRLQNPDQRATVQAELDRARAAAG
jgi:serine/threonine-protein kinase